MSSNTDIMDDSEPSTSTNHVDLSSPVKTPTEIINSPKKTLGLNVSNSPKKSLGSNDLNTPRKSLGSNDSNNEVPSQRISPSGKSRFGRTHKPKLSDDFLSTDKRVGAILGISPANSPRKSGNDSNKDAHLKRTSKNLWSTPDKENGNSALTPSSVTKADYKIDDIAIRHLPGNVLFSEVKVEGAPFIVGDIAWARIGGHPFWPCLIVIDPTVNSFSRRSAYRGEMTRHFLHVQFYADKGRRSWVSVTALLKFEGKEHFLKRAEQLLPGLKKRDKKMALAYTIKPGVQKVWDLAVTEAEEAFKLTNLQRVQEFTRKFPVKEEVNKKEQQLAKIKEALESASSVTPEPAKRGRPPKRKIDSPPTEASSPKKIKSETVVEKVVEKTKENNIENIQDSPIEESPVRRKSGRSFIKAEESEGESLPSKTNDKLKSTPVHKKKPKDKDSAAEKAFQSFLFSQFDMMKEENPNMDDTQIQKRLRSLWDTLDESRKAVYQSKFINADSDAELSGDDKETTTVKPKKEKKKLPKEKSLKNAEEKSSSDEVEETENEQEQTVKGANIAASLYDKKGINLFRGMKNEKVCQICEKAGNTLKCRGPCCGIFHLDCAKERWPTIHDDIQNFYKNKAANIVPSPDLGNIVDSSINNKTVTETDNKTDSVAVAMDIDSPEVKSVESDSTDSQSTVSDNSRTLRSKNTSILQPLPSEVYESDVPSSPDCSKSKNLLKKKLTNIKFKLNGKKKKDEDLEDETDSEFRCGDCCLEQLPPCFVCGEKTEAKNGNTVRQRCVSGQCGKFYHVECLGQWPQTSFTENGSFKKSTGVRSTSLTCPHHACHTCASDDPRNATTRFSHERLVRCIRCPTAYHYGNHCIPAGSQILNTTQIICPRHYKPTRKGINHVNASWCFICATGGSLICCDLCPTSFHADCVRVTPTEEGYVCEDCETGRYPLYGEVVWVKLGVYRWWPAQILFPSEIPDNINNLPHTYGEFAVRFFGSYDHYWVNRGRVFLYQEGDKGYKSRNKNSVDEAFSRAIREAIEVQKLVSQAKAYRDAESRIGMKPPPYIKIKCNKPIGNVRVSDPNISNMTPCDCDPQSENPCGKDSDCLNRILLVECHPSVCPAGERCNNQCFEKRQYPPLVPYRTEGRGWGLKTLADIRKGDFVIEYVGEMIDETEYKRRLEKKYNEKDENYYFLTIDKDRMLDAGPKGNVARFMNHSCQPNCETQKWTVNGDTRVGLFALVDIPANSELTFNYNLEAAGSEKKSCMCGASNCSGFIGVKVVKQPVESEKKSQPDKKQGGKRRKNRRIISEKLSDNLCFKCGKSGETLLDCNNRTCSKSFHVECAGLNNPPGDKWICPWHFCNICKKKTTQRCHSCPSAFCFSHVEGKMRMNCSQQMVCIDCDQETSKEVTSDNVTITKLTVSRNNLENSLTVDSDSDNIKKNNSENTISDTNKNERKTEENCSDDVTTSGEESALPAIGLNDIAEGLEKPSSVDVILGEKRKFETLCNEVNDSINGSKERKIDNSYLDHQNTDEDRKHVANGNDENLLVNDIKSEQKNLFQNIDTQNMPNGFPKDTLKDKQKTLGTNTRKISLRRNSLAAKIPNTIDKYLVTNGKAESEDDEHAKTNLNIEGSPSKVVNGIKDLPREMATVLGV